MPSEATRDVDKICRAPNSGKETERKRRKRIEDTHRSSIYTARIACPRRVWSALAVMLISTANFLFEQILSPVYLHVLYKCTITRADRAIITFKNTALPTTQHYTEADPFAKREVIGTNGPIFFLPTACNVMPVRDKREKTRNQPKPNTTSSM